MLKQLIPKEEKYFEDFKEMIYHISEMAKYTNQFFSSDVIDQSLLLKIKPLEQRCDELSSKIFKRLNKTFITPFDREDIFALVKRLSAISDNLLGATNRVETFNIKEKIKYTDKISAIILQQISELGCAIQDIKARRINECKAVNDLESEADKIYQQANKELFENEKDAIKLIKEKEILDILEKTCDKCQSAANIILSIFIKNN
ncbi:MAG: hypothetical protein A2057_04185 [Ignavibacteria bacterium GWA2_35_9]|nr:MAG: hypothetical protein A2057_04185 [Ignavibacteria bacterium GWA2_35_9]OGU47465.1 MAG: hypothetical protein A2000_16340 [Ignavibacteria bacterium GWB2_36_8]OGU52676.1 MAG: hypothetical protein A2080_00650 [Ignavibacteria bacterium GWC2_36_12]